MAPHAKFFSVNDRPFWREAGLSGTAQSMVGPMPEIRDACTASGQAALFGFLGIGAADRAQLGEAAVSSACLQQLERMFGAEALNPVATIIKDWAADPQTAVSLDVAEPRYPVPVDRWVHGAWSDRLLMAGSETAPSGPGNLSGAIAASKRAVENVLARQP